MLEHERAATFTFLRFCQNVIQPSNQQKSLRQLAEELGVSAGYLFQVKNVRRSISVRIGDRLSVCNRSVKQSVKQNGIISSNYICGGVPELVDGRDLGSRAARRGGSSPPFPI